MNFLRRLQRFSLFPPFPSVASATDPLLDHYFIFRYRDVIEMPKIVTAVNIRVRLRFVYE